MRRFHVVGVADDLSWTLAFPTGDGWLLPWLDDDARSGLPAQIDTLLRRFVARSEMVHEAPLEPTGSPGQVEASCVAVVSEPEGTSEIAKVPHEELQAGRFLIPQQRQAWTNAIRRLTRPTESFDSASQVRAALRWGEEQVLRSSCSTVLSLERHRCTRLDYVVRYKTATHTYYLKAGTARVSDEAPTTALVWRLSPEQFPRTVAVDVQENRWLYEELAGDLLIGPFLTCRSAATAVRALAAIQKKALTAPLLECHLAPASMTSVGLLERVDDLVQRAFHRTERETHAAAFAMWIRHRGQMLASCAHVDALQIPLTLVLSDFWPRNVVATAEGVGFIDLEQCYWSHPMLPLWKFQYRVELSLRTGGLATTLLQQTFVDEWADVVTPSAMRCALDHLPLLGRLFNMLLGSRDLDVYEHCLDAPLPLEYRASDLSPRITKVIEQIGVLRRQSRAPRGL